MYKNMTNGVVPLSLKPKRTKQQQYNIDTFNQYYKQNSNIALNNFEWQNLPDGLISRRFERFLYFNGTCVFFHDEKLGYCVLPTTYNGQLDLYFEPTNWQVLGYNYSKPLNINNSVLIRNNLTLTPTDSDVRFYCNKIADVQRTIDTQLSQLKSPYIIKTNDKKLMSHKNILSRKEDNEIAIFVNGSVGIEDMQIVPTPTAYVIDKLTAYKTKLESELYTLLGFDNLAMEKSERLITTEVEKNEEITDNGYVNVMLEMRKESCEQINNMFGLNINVKLKRREENARPDEFYPDIDGDIQGLV